MNYPNLFIVGAMKAGTTAFYNILDKHPNICMSAIKEPNYYSDDLWCFSNHISSDNKIASSHNAVIKDIDTYLSLFSKCCTDASYCGESSPSYLLSKKAAKNIFSDSPDAKIIILLRDPIERAWSHYLMERCELRVPESFKELIDYELSFIGNGKTTQYGIIESGLYFENISRYLSFFPRKNIMIIDLSEIHNNFDNLTRRMNLFFGFDVNYFTSSPALSNATVVPRAGLLNKMLIKFKIKKLVRSLLPQPVINSFKFFYYKKPPKYSEIDQKILDKLLNFYSEDIKKLDELLGESHRKKWMDKYINIIK